MSPTPQDAAILHPVVAGVLFSSLFSGILREDDSLQDLPG